MAYAKQTWTDGVTPADKAHMDHIEDGIVSMGDGSGLPPQLQPLAIAPTSNDLNLVTASGFYAVASVTNGPYAGANGYVQAIVGDANNQVQNFWTAGYGFSYTRQKIAGSWSSWYSIPSVKASPITSPPAGPGDWDTWYATSGIPHAYTWGFTWNPAGRWDFVGGAPAFDYNSNAVPATSTWAPIIQYTVPRAGVYAFSGSLAGQMGANPGTFMIGLGKNGVVALQGGAASGTAYEPVSCTTLMCYQTCAQNDTLQVFGWCNVAAVTWNNHFINVLPVYVT